MVNVIIQKRANKKYNIYLAKYSIQGTLEPYELLEKNIKTLKEAKLQAKDMGAEKIVLDIGKLKKVV